MTLGEIMRAVRTGQVRVNSKRTHEPGYHVHAGDELVVPFAPPDEARPSARHSSWGKIQVIFHGRNVLIVNKPAGLLVQPDEAGGDSVISRVWGVLGTKTPAAVHRLDRNTTGVLAVSLHGDALRALEALFKARQVRKFYLAVVVGRAPDEVVIDAPLLKDPENNTVKVSDEGVRAVTKCISLAHSDGAVTQHALFAHGVASSEEAWTTAKHSFLVRDGVGAADSSRIVHSDTVSDDKAGATAKSVSRDGAGATARHSHPANDEVYSLVRLELLTGRTHQARVHMASIGCPILGDRKYGDFKINRLNKNITRPLLHAYELVFPEDIHESLSEIAGKTFRASIPEDIMKFIEARGLRYED